MMSYLRSLLKKEDSPLPDISRFIIRTRKSKDDADLELKQSTDNILRMQREEQHAMIETFRHDRGALG